MMRPKFVDSPICCGRSAGSRIASESGNAPFASAGVTGTSTASPAVNIDDARKHLSFRMLARPPGRVRSEGDVEILCV